MTNGYWIDPKGREYEVHASPPHTHAGWAIKFLGGESDSDPVLALLKRGWVRVSCETVSVFGMDDEKRARIAGFVRARWDYYENCREAFLEDEQAGTSVRMSWASLARHSGEGSS
jgi:ribulose bisphosphate carboxylase small subunit